MLCDGCCSSIVVWVFVVVRFCSLSDVFCLLFSDRVCEDCCLLCFVDVRCLMCVVYCFLLVV